MADTRILSGDECQVRETWKGDLKVAAYQRHSCRYELQFIYGLSDAELDAVEAEGAAWAMKEIIARCGGLQ